MKTSLYSIWCQLTEFVSYDYNLYRRWWNTFEIKKSKWKDVDSWNSNETFFSIAMDGLKGKLGSLDLIKKPVKDKGISEFKLPTTRDVGVK